MMLRFERVVATGNPALDSGIGDTALKTLNGETYLYGATGPGGGLAVWKLVDDAAPVLQDTQFFNNTISLQVGDSVLPVTLAGQDHLVLDVDNAAGLVSYQLNSDGTFDGLVETGNLTGGGNLGAMTQLAVGGLDLLAVSHEATGQIGTYQVGTDGSLTLAGLVTGQASAMTSLQSGSGRFLATVDAASNSVAVYMVDPIDGTLALVDTAAATQTLGITTPTAIESIEAFGQSWLIVAGAESNSLSLLKLGPDGHLTPTDHVLDSRHTRFEAVQDISVVEISGQVFVVAGGGDDGVSLFSMTANGKLVHRDSFADTLSSGLQNVETLVAAQLGDTLQIFASAQEDAGLTQLTVSLETLGVVAEGFGTVTGTAGDDMLTGGILDTVLLAGAGDDILVSGTGTATMTGGAGADIFVMRYGSGTTTITDFEVGSDRLDLFDFPMLRNPGQLTVTSTALGAEISYLDASVVVVSAAGAPLSSTEIFGSEFGGPDHIPVDFSAIIGSPASPGVTGPVTVDSGSENPALSNAEITFSPDGGAPITVQADADGRFDLGLPGGSFAGELDITKGYSTASGQITALDALQVLRISVGLDPTWGPAAAENLIAADVTRDGTVNALDALSILQVAVGLPSIGEAEWVFLDDEADLSAVTRTNVDYQTGTTVTAVDGHIAADMTAILLGNLEAV